MTRRRAARPRLFDVGQLITNRCAEQVWRDLIRIDQQRQAAHI